MTILQILSIPFDQEGIQYELIDEIINTQNRIRLCNDGQTPCEGYFSIQSQLKSHDGSGYCFQPMLNSKHGGKNFIVAAMCNGSSSQEWLLNEKGYLQNQRRPKQCIKRQKRWVKIDNCTNDDDDALKWILSSDGTIRWGPQALFAIKIPVRSKRPSKSKRKTTQLVVRKITRRAAKVNEKWLFRSESVHDSDGPSEIPTESPSTGPIAIPSQIPSLNSLRTSNPASPLSLIPSTIHTSFPTARPSNDRNNGESLKYQKKPIEKAFSISLLNMGQEHKYDEAFEKAKQKLEKIIIGVLVDQQANSSPLHDWFAGTWPDNPVNVHIDDILIGYEVTNIDGIEKTLGFAGPVYVRRKFRNDQMMESFTTISG